MRKSENIKLMIYLMSQAIDKQELRVILYF
jgi:hypothetical protein